MNSFIIEIAPKKAALDPLAAHVRLELIEDGQPPKSAAVQTRRLYSLRGNFQLSEIEKIAGTLLVDPVVEKWRVESEPQGKKGKKESKTAGWIVDIWPRAGVTDPVGETVEKGLRDLGYHGEFHAASATRYIFPQIPSQHLVKNLAKRLLANELIHDIQLRRDNETR